MNFIESRDSLFKKALTFEKETDVTGDFTRKFNIFIEKIVISMLNGEDSFFGNFMIKVERKIRLNISWPIGTKPKIEGYEMYFNPMLILQYSQKEIEALIKHEIYHIMYNHFNREKELKQRFNKLAVSLALDISINQFIKNMPGDAKRIESISNEFDVELKDNRSVEEYAYILHTKMEQDKKEKKKKGKSSKIVREIDEESAHDIWEEIDLSQDSLKDITRKTAMSSLKGTVPKNILKIIQGYSEKEEISWQKLLKNLLPSIKNGQKKTSTRRNRRQPERLDIRGSLSDKTPEIIVAIDISASMTENDIRKIIIEVLALTRDRVNKITVIECDNEIRSIYNLTSSKDIRERSKKNGATAFTPVFNYIRENNMRNRILIYFTDGVGEKELGVKPINSKTIWVLTGDENLSLEKPFGEVKRLERNIVKGEGKNAAIEIYRDILRESIGERV